MHLWPTCAFIVRFGIKDGKRRAYLTVDYHDDNPGTLVDVEVANGALVVTQTELYPPGSPRCQAWLRRRCRLGRRQSLVSLCIEA